jgi:hypothetical protein
MHGFFVYPPLMCSSFLGEKCEKSEKIPALTGFLAEIRRDRENTSKSPSDSVCQVAQHMANMHA